MCKKYDSEEKMRERFDNSINSGKYTPSEDANDVDEAYEIWKFDKGVHDENDYEWKNGYPPSEASYDEIRASYDRMVESENDDNEDD